AVLLVAHYENPCAKPAAGRSALFRGTSVTERQYAMRSPEIHQVLVAGGASFSGRSVLSSGGCTDSSGRSSSSPLPRCRISVTCFSRSGGSTAIRLSPRLRSTGSDFDSVSQGCEFDGSSQVRKITPTTAISTPRATP